MTERIIAAPGQVVAISPDAESERRFGMDVDPADGDAV